MYTVIFVMIAAVHILMKMWTSWPIGLRRNAKAVVLVGVGLNHTDVITYAHLYFYQKLDKKLLPRNVYYHHVLADHAVHT